MSIYRLTFTCYDEQYTSLYYVYKRKKIYTILHNVTYYGDHKVS